MMRKEQVTADQEDQEVQFKVLVTYSKWGPEASEAGEADEVGVHYESDVYDAAELGRLARDLGLHEVSIHSTGEGPTLTVASVTPNENREYFEESISTYYQAHLELVNGERPTLAGIALAVKAMDLKVPEWVQDLGYRPEELWEGPGL